MRLFLFSILWFLGLVNFVFSQQRSLISNYLQNGIVISPAYTGSAGALSLSLSSRLQWQGVENAPITNIVAAHTPLPFRYLSTGLLVSYDKFGYNNTTDVSNTYALRFKIRQYSISLGGLIGFQSINRSLDQSRLVDQGDEAFANLNSFTLKTGFGLHLEHKKFYVGFSIPSMALSSSGSGIANGIFYNQQFYYGGYNWKINDKFVLKPSVYIRNIAGSGILPDINLMVTALNRFTGGFSYRHNYAMVALANVKVNNQLYVGYSYDYLMGGNSSISAVSKGSHEIFIRYDFMYLVNDINMKKFK